MSNFISRSPESIDTELNLTYSMADLRDLVTHDEAKEINQYHIANIASLGNIVRQPIPQDFQFQNPTAANVLPNNRTTYGQGIESEIICDDVIRALKLARKNHEFSSDLIVPSVRTRRSIVAILFKIPEFSTRE